MYKITLQYNGIQKKVSWNPKRHRGQTVNLSAAEISSWPIVEDQVRGYYKINTPTQWVTVSPNQIKKDTLIFRLALIVESPHKAEFDSIFNPLNPLNGTSGTKFANDIYARLNTWLQNVNIENQIVEVKIINPICYQTSLYHFLNNMIPYNNHQSGNIGYTRINKTLRNKVWDFLFNTCSLKTDFIKALQNYSPDFIVNCCTGTVVTPPITQASCQGSKPKDYVRLELLNNTLIKTNNGVFNYFEDNHPSTW